MSNFFILTFSGLGFLFLIIVFLIYQVFSLKRRLNRFLQNGDKDLEQLLNSQVAKTEHQQQQIEDVFQRIDNLEEISQITFQKVGLVRFNPFKETGSDQSFSVALLNAEDNGFVITSLYGREDNRVYAKPIEAGQSDYSLAEEEQQAIEKAKQNNYEQ